METAWWRVASVDDIWEGGTLRVAVAGEPVCLYRVDGVIHATHDTCTHAQASLSEGYVDGDCIECPLHQAVFHIPTGEARSAIAPQALRTYPVRTDGNDVLVRAL